MKKLLMGGALLGSTVMFGNLLSPMLSRKVSADSQDSAIAYRAQVSNLLPKPARQPSMLHVGSIHDGTASLQLAVIAGILARNQPQIYLTDSSFVDNNLEQVSFQTLWSYVQQIEQHREIGFAIRKSGVR